MESVRSHGSDHLGHEDIGASEVPIGLPLAHGETHLIEETASGSIAATGELCLFGAALVRRCVNLAEPIAEKFVVND